MRLALILVALVAMTGTAAAGACPVCDGPEDCPGGFCVLHDSDVGCGAMLQICCPGQGCGLGGDGRPTCEAAGTCVVVGENGTPDAGAIDAAPLPDGLVGFDASGGDTTTDDGCSCRAGGAGRRGAADAAALVVVAAGLAGLLATRGRRR